MPNIDDNLGAQEVQKLLREQGFSNYRFDNINEEVKFSNIQDWCKLGDKLGIDYKHQEDEDPTQEYQEVSFHYQGWEFKSGTFTR